MCPTLLYKIDNTKLGKLNYGMVVKDAHNWTATCKKNMVYYWTIIN